MMGMSLRPGMATEDMVTICLRSEPVPKYTR